MTVKKDGSAVMEWPEQYEDADVKVSMQYSIDKDTKTFILSSDQASVKAAAEASGGAVTEEGLSSSVNALAATYDYNVEHGQLTLTDREYGDQMVFDKQ